MVHRLSCIVIDTFIWSVDSIWSIDSFYSLDVDLLFESKDSFMVHRHSHMLLLVLLLLVFPLLLL